MQQSFRSHFIFRYNKQFAIMLWVLANSFWLLSLAQAQPAKNFAEERRNIGNSFTQSGIRASNVRLAILFETEQQELLRQRVDLVEFRRSLAQSFLQDYAIADPTLTNTTLERNDLSLTATSSPEELRKAAELLGSNHVLFVRVRPLGEDLAVRYQVVNPTGQSLHEAEYYYPLSSLQQAVKAEPLNKEFQQFQEETTNFFEEDSNKLGDVYSDEDLSWGYFAPAAPLSPYTNNFYLSTALTNIEDVEGSIGYLRYDVKASIFQGGFQSYGGNNGKHHSSYAYGKINVFSRESTNLPISMSLGLRGRLYWNELNKDFIIEKKEEQARKNKKRDSLTFLFAFQWHIEPLSLVTDLYADNLKGVFGIRWLLPASTRLFTEVLGRGFESDHLAFRKIIYGVEHAPIPNIKLFLAYEDEQHQTILGGKFSW